MARDGRAETGFANGYRAPERLGQRGSPSVVSVTDKVFVCSSRPGPVYGRLDLLGHQLPGPRVVQSLLVDLDVVAQNCHPFHIRGDVNLHGIGRVRFTSPRIWKG